MSGTTLDGQGSLRMDGAPVTPGTTLDGQGCLRMVSDSRNSTIYHAGTTLDGQGSLRMDGTPVTPGTVQYPMSGTTLDGQGSLRMVSNSRNNTIYHVRDNLGRSR